MVLLSASCGGSSDDDSSAPEADSSASAGSTAGADAADDAAADEGESDSSTGGALDLGDFPIPAAPGGELFAELSSGAGFVLSYPASEFDALVAFYEIWANEATPGDDPPLTFLVDDADQQLAASVAVSETELHQVTIESTDGELRLGLTIIGG